MDPKLMQLCADHTRPEEINGRKIIDVGSYDINGSFRSVLEKLNPEKYLGIDIEFGKGVDEICAVNDVVEKYGVNSFDVVVCTEAIEHIQDWRTAINNLKKICKVGGTILLTSRSKGFGYHAFPHDHWRYELEDIAEIFSNWKIEVLCEDMFNGDHYGFFLKAKKVTEELVDLSDIALFNIHTDRRQGLFNPEIIEGLKAPVIMRRIKSEEELTEEEINPPVRYW